jgi:acylpyruvate hydrolase
MRDSNTDRLIFSVSALIQMISVAMSLEPGDVFEVEIEGLGVLSNPILDE